MDPNKDFQQSMHQLVDLIKKVILHLPHASFKDAPAAFQKESSVNVNFCFFNFLPMTPEELDEFEGMYEEFLMSQEEKGSELKSDLSLADREFLKRNGLRF
ncbi:MAG: hypothetical protein EXS63_05015 [Candidatus Omnitrophica bacterium]|nr:hypothetical protein [Candidatus Omnitrophota bacterium]